MAEVASITMSDNIALVTIDNPPVNALAQSLRAGLKQAFVELVAALETAKRIKKTGVVAKVCHGFIGNRMISVRIESIRTEATVIGESTQGVGLDTRSC